MFSLELCYWVDDILVSRDSGEAGEECHGCLERRTISSGWLLATALKLWRLCGRRNSDRGDWRMGRQRMRLRSRNLWMMLQRRCYWVLSRTMNNKTKRRVGRSSSFVPVRLSASLYLCTPDTGSQRTMRLRRNQSPRVFDTSWLH
jgi:hypothetical protein